MKALWQVEYRQAHHIINKLHTTMELCQNGTDTRGYYWTNLGDSRPQTLIIFYCCPLNIFETI